MSTYREKCLLRVQLSGHEVEQVRVGSLKCDVRLRLSAELYFPLAILCVHDPRRFSAALVPLDLEREDALDVLHEVFAVRVEGAADSVKYHCRLEVAG